MLDICNMCQKWFQGEVKVDRHVEAHKKPEKHFCDKEFFKKNHL